jgi:hypothetical protein
MADRKVVSGNPETRVVTSVTRPTTRSGVAFGAPPEKVTFTPPPNNDSQNKPNQSSSDK